MVAEGLGVLIGEAEGDLADAVGDLEDVVAVAVTEAGVAGVVVEMAGGAAAGVAEEEG